MNAVQKLITGTVAVVASGVLVSAVVFLNTYNDPSTGSSSPRSSVSQTKSATGLLGVSDEKNVLAIAAKLDGEPVLKSGFYIYTIQLTIQNLTSQTIQFSPSLDLFARDNAGKTRQVTTDENGQLNQGAFAAKDSRTGTVNVQIPEGNVLDGVFYQPNNASQSYQLTLN